MLHALSPALRFATNVKTYTKLWAALKLKKKKKKQKPFNPVFLKCNFPWNFSFLM